MVAKCDVVIVVDSPRYLVVTVKGPALNARLGSAHLPCEGDEAVPAFWVELSRLVLVHSNGWFVILGVDVNAQPVPCVGIVTGDVARAGGASADVACSCAAAAFQHLGLWLPAAFGSCSRAGMPEKALVAWQ